MDQLRGWLAHVGYTGPELKGYTVEVAERITVQIKCYLAKEIFQGMDWKDFFIINEDDGFNIVVHDLNWKLIKKCFFKTLSQEKYFIQEPSQEVINNLSDCAFFSNLFFTEDHLLGIESQCFNENSIFHLKKIKTDFPAFWQKLRLGFQHNPDLTKKIPLLFSELEEAPLSVSTLEEIVLLFDLDLSSLINDKSILDLSAKLIQKEINGCNTLMLAASKRPEVINFILKFIAEHPSLINKETLQQMFLQQESNGWNALMLAAYNRPDALNFMLKFIADHPSLFDKETLQQMFLQKVTNARDILKNLKKMPLLLLQIVNNPLLIIANEQGGFRQFYLTIKNVGLDALSLAARFQPDGLNSMLKFAAEHSDLFDKEILKQVMAKNTAHGWNFFIIKALLEKYLAGISDRKAQNITHTTTFSTGFFKYNFGYSTQEKEMAASQLMEILETGLEKPEPIENLVDLQQSHPALSNGRLGRLFELCCKIASDATALDKVRNIMKDKEEYSTVLRQNPR